MIKIGEKMPKKYHIDIKQTPPRFIPMPKYCQLEKEGCLGCLVCVKRSSCVYEVYKKREYSPWEFIDTGDSMCLGCFRCVQECKKNIISRSHNPAYMNMGDDYWKPDMLKSLWNQAETGKIPVSGAGYRGKFSNPGFDRIWTDMSEIVRPTRDGIHGREYISAVVDLGSNPARLEFDGAGNLLNKMPPSVEIPIPIILEAPAFGIMGRSGNLAIVEAAARLGTLAAADAEFCKALPAELGRSVILKLSGKIRAPKSLKDYRIVEMDYHNGIIKTIRRLKYIVPDTIFSISIPMDEHAVARASRLAGSGAEMIRLIADNKGKGFGKRKNDFITEIVRDVHERLVKDRVRERVTVVASGGIALAEHVAKTIICGADAVGVDLALLVALGCRLCRNCGPDAECPVGLENPPSDWAAQRIVNLIGSWHSQLLEVLGAMGIREVRRLRGEMGRAMFLENLERECFDPIFGENMEKPRIIEAPKDIVKPSPQVDKLVSPCPPRFKNQLGKFRVERTTACIACGKCAEVCAYGVHVKAGSRMLCPKSHLCDGPEKCKAAGAFCEDKCRQNAIRVGADVTYETFGDPRWTADLLLSTWIQSETGKPPMQDIEYKVGESGGGFDLMSFEFPANPPDPNLKDNDIDLSIELNRNDPERPRVKIDFPIYGGGMSFGSISLPTMVSRARAYKALNSFTCTGEGGYPEALYEFDDNVITQVATGLFGVSEDTIQRVRIVEFKYAQGAKPGLGGHLLGDKVTPAVAKMREAVEGSALFSPFPFHSVYSVEDHKKHVDWIKAVNPKALISVKVSTPSDVDMVAVGIYHAGAHIIHLDGSYGGTGAAPDIAKKNIAMPIEFAIPKVHKFLMDEGIRDKITLIVSGGLRTAYDVAKAISLGADGVVIGTAEMIALECIRCANCESGRGCPRGIATTDPGLSSMYNADWGAQRIINLYASWCSQLRDILRRFGFRSVRQLVGRSDLIRYMRNEKCPA